MSSLLNWVHCVFLIHNRKQKLNRGSVNEMFQKFSLRGGIEAQSETAWNQSKTLASTKQLENEKRERRMESGNAYAKRFKKKKKQGGWVD